MELEQRAYDAACRQMLYVFTWRGFAHLQSGERFVPNWHVEAVCHALEGVVAGTTPKLIINLPPRYLKSICASVAQKAALVVMGVEQRQLLMAMDDVERVVDIEGNACRRGGIARQPQIEQHLAEADDGAQVRQVLGPRAGRLGAQVHAAVGQAPAGQLEGRIETQNIKVVAIFITAGNSKQPRPDHVGVGVGLSLIHI